MSNDPRFAAAEIQFQQGRSRHRAGDWSGARGHYQAALSLYPDHAEALHGLGAIEFRAGNLDRAVELMSAAIERRPDYGNAFFNLGNVYRALSQFESARRCYQNSVALMPNDAQAHNYLGMVLIALGLPDQAVTSFETAIALDPQYLDARAGLGFALLDAGRNGAAVLNLAKRIEMGPPDMEVFRALAESQGRLGHYAEAVAAYRALLQIAPDDLDAHQRLGLALEALGEFREALGVMDRAVALKPQDPISLTGRASILSSLGDYDAAIRDLSTLLVVDPNYPGAHFKRGRYWLDAGCFLEALEEFDRAISVGPTTGLNFSARGDALRSLDRHEEAVAAYRQALQLDDSVAEVHNNLAVTLRLLGRLEESLAQFERALSLKPDFALAQANIGGVLRDLHRLDAAVVALSAAVILDPKLGVAQRILGDVYRMLGQPDQAAMALERAIALDPLDAEALMVYGHTLFDKACFVEAVECYDRAIKIKPDLESLPGLRLFTKLYVCDWQDFEKERAALVGRIKNKELVCAPFASLVLFDSLEIVRDVATIFALQRFKGVRQLPHIDAYKQHPKIRIGYFSADFFEHATTHLMIDLFEHHNRDAFELVAISFGPDVRDAMRLRLEGVFDQFHDVRNRSDVEIAELARQLEIDIAVDLKGYTANYRPAIFVLRAAPVQVSYLGYPGTLQMEAMDYLIADPVLVPKESQKFYSEKIAYLPHTYQPNDTGRQIADREFTRAELGLPESAFVFCCFNNNFKLLPRMFGCWMKILAAVPDGVLWLLGDNEVVIRNLRQEAEHRGIDGSRLVFGKRLPSADHLARHRAADLFLDALPYNAHTTASDALWTGLPVLTLAGEAFASRVAASLLHAIDLPELVTYSEADYLVSAVALSKDRLRLNEIKQRLHTSRNTVPLFDIVRFTRDLESLYVRMHDASLQGLIPDHLEPHES